MFKKIRKKLKEIKGLNTIETAICTMIILVAIGGLIDLNGIMKKFNATASTTSYIARTISKQGGVRMNKPSSYSGQYVTSQSLYEDVKSNLNNAGIKDSEFRVRINGYTLSPNSNVPIVSYGGDLKVELTINYSWKLLSQFNGSQNFSKTSNRIVASSFKNRTSTNIGSTVQ